LNGVQAEDSVTDVINEGEGCVCLNNVPFRTKQRLVIGSRLEMSREEHILKLSQDPCVV